MADGVCVPQAEHQDLTASVACIGGNEWLLAGLGRGGLFWFSAAVFVVAWVGQFMGHHIEGKKPSFLQDVQFLLIGPAWLMAFVYRKLGIKI